MLGSSETSPINFQDKLLLQFIRPHLDHSDIVYDKPNNETFIKHLLLDDDLPLSEVLSIHVCIVVAGSVFQEDNNYYPQVYLCLYEHEYEDEEKKLTKLH